MSAEAETNEIQSERRSTRRSKKENMKEVELIQSEKGREDEVAELVKDNAQTRTPRRRTTNVDGAKTPQRSVLQEALQTPRRSVRKSVKPTQEYEDIVGKRMLISTAKENDDNIKEVTEVEEQQHPKWTPAKVGRVSQKRGRKSRRAGGKKQAQKEIGVSDERDVEGEGRAELIVVQQMSEIKLDMDGTEKEDEANTGEETNREEAGGACEASDVRDVNTRVQLHLKLEELDDLGVAPLQIIEKPLVEIDTKIEDKMMAEKSEKKEEFEEMPSLIVFDDEDEYGNEGPKTGGENPKERELPCTETTANETLNASDCIILSPVEEKSDSPTVATENDNESTVQTIELANKDAKNTSMPRIGTTTPSVSVDDFGNEGPKPSGDNPEETEVPCTETAANDTFNASDCIILSPVEEKSDSPTVATENDNESTVQTIELANKDAKNTSMPRIVVTTPGVTPKKRPKAYRFPTPYRNKASFKFQPEGKEIEVKMMQCKEDDSTKDKSNILSTTLPVIMMEPKEIVLRSIRKRSLSVCIDGELEKRKALRSIHRVTFHSPANQTAVIEDLDLLIAKSVKKTSKTLPSSIPKLKPSNDTNVTKRRKRSMSFDESLMNNATKLYKSGMTTRITPKKLCPTPQKSTTTAAPVPMRTKLPNFSAIHQKHFNKMENLVEHVARKAERAKVLVTSATKPRSASAQKGFPTKNQHIDAKNAEKPKAMKKIDLGNTKETRDATATITTAAEVAPAKKATVHIDEGKQGIVNVMATPRLAVIRPMHLAAVAAPVAVAMKKKATPVKRVLRPVTQVSQAPVAKPAFNLSTSTRAVIKPASNMPEATRENLSREDKTVTRRQRHMEMFKGRTGAATRKNGELIRGVRSNRRFELQMQHRRHMETDHN